MSKLQEFLPSLKKIKKGGLRRTYTYTVWGIALLCRSQLFLKTNLDQVCSTSKSWLIPRNNISLIEVWNLNEGFKYPWIGNGNDGSCGLLKTYGFYLFGIFNSLLKFNVFFQIKVTIQGHGVGRKAGMIMPLL